MPEKKRRSEWTFQDWLEYETSSKHTFYKASDGYWCFNTAECLCSRASENRDEAARLSVEYACDTKGLSLPWLPDIEPPQTISECLERFAENGFEVSIQIARNAEMQIDIYSGQTYPVWNGICEHCRGTGLSEEGAHLVATVERLAEELQWAVERAETLEAALRSLAYVCDNRG